MVSVMAVVLLLLFLSTSLSSLGLCGGVAVASLRGGASSSSSSRLSTSSKINVNAYSVSEPLANTSSNLNASADVMNSTTQAQAQAQAQAPAQEEEGDENDEKEEEDADSERAHCPTRSWNFDVVRKLGRELLLQRKFAQAHKCSTLAVNIHFQNFERQTLKEFQSFGKAQSKDFETAEAKRNINMFNNLKNLQQSVYESAVQSAKLRHNRHDQNQTQNQTSVSVSHPELDIQTPSDWPFHHNSDNNSDNGDNNSSDEGNEPGSDSVGSIDENRLEQASKRRRERQIQRQGWKLEWWPNEVSRSKSVDVYQQQLAKSRQQLEVAVNS